MYFYFSSDFPAVIKLDGIYYGSIENTIKHLKIESPFSVFIEVCSVSPNFRSFSFVLDNDFLSSPTDNVIITDLNGGYLIKFISQEIKPDFEMYAQEKTPDYIATIFNDNGKKITIETANDFYLENVNCKFNSATIQEYYENGNFLIINFCGEQNVLTIYKLNQKIEKVLEEQIYDFSVENGLLIQKRYKDVLKHKIKLYYKYNGEKFEIEKKEVEKSNQKELNPKIIPYAFCEEILADGDITSLVTQNILNKKDRLLDYMGNFLGVMPPPFYRDCNEVGLIYKKKNNLFYVEYFIFDIVDNKVDNIKKV